MLNLWPHGHMSESYPSQFFFVCRIRGSQCSCYEESYLLGHNDMQSIETQCSGGTSRLHLKNESISQANFAATCFILISCLAYSLTLKTGVTCSFKTSVDFQWTTCHYIPHDRILHFSYFASNCKYSVSLNYIPSIQESCSTLIGKQKGTYAYMVMTASLVRYSNITQGKYEPGP
jgi:hypothetical protein